MKAPPAGACGSLAAVSGHRCVAWLAKGISLRRNVYEGLTGGFGGCQEDPGGMRGQTPAARRLSRRQRS